MRQFLPLTFAAGEVNCDYACKEGMSYRIACAGEEVKQVKKTLSKEALVKEAAFWSRLAKAAKENPGKVCHK